MRGLVCHFVRVIGERGSLLCACCFLLCLCVSVPQHVERIQGDILIVAPGL